MRDSQCIGRQSIPIFHSEPKVNTMKIYESDIPFERFRVYKIKIRIDSKKKKKKRSNHFPLSYEHFYERSLRDASNDSTIKKIVSPIIPKFSPIPTSRDQFTTIKGD